MPLNRPALSLGPGPRGVQDARRWVVQACEDLGRPELAECAELGVSELVTNALLHGEPPIQVGLRGTREHPRVEVRDGSSEAPVLPTEMARHEEDGLLLTFGRGLSIVARSATAWGADVEADGKVVWFTPAHRFSDGEGVPGLVTGAAAKGPADAEVVDDPVTVAALGVPVDSYLGFQRHFRELRREVRLLSLAHRSDYPVAQRLAELFSGVDRQLRQGMGMEQIDAALSQGRSSADLELVTSRTLAREMGRVLELLDLADEFCRGERLLSLSRSEQQHRFQRWFLGEFVRQGQGGEPSPWEPDQPSSPPASQQGSESSPQASHAS